MDICRKIHVAIEDSAHKDPALSKVDALAEKAFVAAWKSLPKQQGDEDYTEPKPRS